MYSMSVNTTLNRVFSRDWEMIRDKNNYYYPNYPPPLPGVYVLAVSKGAGQKMVIYVGKSDSSISDRISKYARNGAHISDCIEKYLKKGYSLFYKYRICTRVDPEELEEYLLERLDFPCNSMKNSGYWE